MTAVVTKKHLRYLFNTCRLLSTNNNQENSKVSSNNNENAADEKPQLHKETTRSLCSPQRISFSCISVRSVEPRRAYTGSHAPEPPDPLTCCGQRCPDCVWIVYGMQLLHYYSDRPVDELLRLLDEEIPNVGIREYVKGELRAKIKRRQSP
uniref:Oxidoreductase-like domain-containing protein n=1 Tax=Parascaris univalens TaxID=6257 RepID=A0A915A594_PARUN